jgi:peptidoglycan/LPS O-acetylase OafA/YrhL
VPHIYRSRHVGGPPPPGWSLSPAWGQPLDDPLPLRAVGPVGRWLWPALAVGGFLLVTGFVVGHDDPHPGLSRRGLLTITLAAAVVILLTIRRSAGSGPLARALFEYAVVFLLAMLLATTGINLDQAPGGKQASAARDQRPALIKAIDGFGDWLREWRTWASKETNRRAQSSAAPSASPPLFSSTRRPL